MEMNVILILHLLVLPMALLPAVCLSAGGSNDLHPLVLIPGSGGNQLEARLTKDYKPSSLLCALSATRKGKDGWFRLWFDPTVLVPALTRCFAERMTLYYHAALDDYRNAPGVLTRVPCFGSTQGLVYLDPHLKWVLFGSRCASASLLDLPAPRLHKGLFAGISPNTWQL